MARLEFSGGFFDDIDRFTERMAEYGIENAGQRIKDILHVIDILRHSPLIGRPARGGKRELIIGRDARGYVVLYRFNRATDDASILAIRSQRESGYKRQPDEEPS